ncbi:hypothetical protein V6259_12900 [Marinomonas sp. TI.3.20]|uniref:hypothetical protein n=1 Tax=Marinomonas sp. TI.3.20 TaxID=3121296 RepID=UPI00311DD335
MKVHNIVKLLAVAKEYGISTINQLEIFLVVANTSAPSLSLLDLANTDDPRTASYRKALGIFTKLSTGSQYRNRDGLNLLTYAECGLNRRIWLTRRGEDLRAKLENIFTQS